MNHLPLNHAWSNEDSSYHRLDGSVYLKIGAMSYASSLYVHDYAEFCHHEFDPGSISIGKYCSLAHNIEMMLYGAHNIGAVTTSPLMPLIGTLSYGISDLENINIGNDVWIGRGAKILSGCRSIGHGAVIGAYAVIAKDVPPYAVVVGNPGKIVKYRFNEDQIYKLLAIAWWDWPCAKVVEHSEHLLGIEIDSFIQAHYEKL